MKVACGTHGERAWSGEIVCDRCGRLFKSAKLAPKRCACGVQLLPAKETVAAFAELYEGKTPADEPLQAEFSARICCSDCFKLHYPRVRMA